MIGTQMTDSHSPDSYRDTENTDFHRLLIIKQIGLQARQPYCLDLALRSNLAFADNDVGNGFGLVGRLNCLAYILLASLLNAVGKDGTDGESHKRLNEKHLREVGKRQVVAHKSEPAAQSVNNAQTFIIRIIQEDGYQTH